MFSVNLKKVEEMAKTATSKTQLRRIRNKLHLMRKNAIKQQDEKLVSECNAGIEVLDKELAER